MDAYDNWECVVSQREKADIKDLDEVAIALSRCSDTRILKKILMEIYDTDNLAYILEEVAIVFDVSLKKIVYEDENNFTVTAEKHYNE